MGTARRAPPCLPWRCTTEIGVGEPGQARGPAPTMRPSLCLKMAQRLALLLSLVGKGGHTGPALRLGSFPWASSGLAGITTLEPARGEALELARSEHGERLEVSPGPWGARAAG